MLDIRQMIESFIIRLVSPICSPIPRKPAIAPFLPWIIRRGNAASENITSNAFVNWRVASALFSLFGFARDGWLLKDCFRHFINQHVG